jgi:hypothetical protein
MPRQRKVDDETLRTLEQQLAKAQRKLRQARAIEKDQARKDDTRRGVIAGHIALNHFERNAGSEWGKTYFRLLDEYVLPRDRFLFEFLPVREAPPASQEAIVGADQPDTLNGEPDKLNAAE